VICYDLVNEKIEFSFFQGAGFQKGGGGEAQVSELDAAAEIGNVALGKLARFDRLSQTIPDLLAQLL
jgi:hypothetical protein